MVRGQGDRILKKSRYIPKRLLAKVEKKEYRLPTEAEWEYACRAVISDQLSVTSGELTKAEWNEKYNQPFHFGETISTELANYNGNYTYGEGVKGEYRKQTTPVGYFEVANALVYTICTVTYGNGAKMTGMAITMAHLLMAGLGDRKKVT